MLWPELMMVGVTMADLSDEVREWARRSLVWTGVLLGIGLVASLDEIIFHQLLQWHNLYVDTDDYWRIFSDGLLHLATTALLAIGAARLWMDRELLAAAGNRSVLIASMLFGGGGFQVFDGIVNHKVLRLHPVREDAGSLLLYDLAWNAGGLLLIAVGWFIWWRQRFDEPSQPPWERHRKSSRRSPG